MKPSHLSQLQIDPAMKRRPGGSVKAIFIIVAVALAAAGYFAWSRPDAESRIIGANSDAGKPAETVRPETRNPKLDTATSPSIPKPET